MISTSHVPVTDIFTKSEMDQAVRKKDKASLSLLISIASLFD